MRAETTGTAGAGPGPPHPGWTPAGTAAAGGTEAARIPEEQTSTIQPSRDSGAAAGARAESISCRCCRARAGSSGRGRAAAPAAPLCPRCPGAPPPRPAGSSCSAPPRGAPPSTTDLWRGWEVGRAGSLWLLPWSSNLLLGLIRGCKQHPEGCSQPAARCSPLRRRPMVWEKP